MCFTRLTIVEGCSTRFNYPSVRRLDIATPPFASCFLPAKSGSFLYFGGRYRTASFSQPRGLDDHVRGGRDDGPMAVGYRQGRYSPANLCAFSSNSTLNLCLLSRNRLLSILPRRGEHAEADFFMWNTSARRITLCHHPFNLVQDGPWFSRPCSP